MLAHPERDAGPVGHDGLDRAVLGVHHVVEAGDVDVARDREAAQQLVATAGSVLGLPLPDDVGDREDDLLAVAEDGGVEELRDRLGVERRMASGQDDRVVLGAVGGAQRDAGEVERVDHVGVAELGGEAEPEEVEVTDRAVGVDGELRDGLLAQHPLHVRPHRVGALGDDPVALVEHLVEDLDALVGQADLVGVGVHQRPADGLATGLLGAGTAVPVLDRGVQLAADVLDRLGDSRQVRLEELEDGLSSAQGGGGGHGLTSAARVRSGQGTNVRRSRACHPVRDRPRATRAARPGCWWACRSGTGWRPPPRCRRPGPRRPRWPAAPPAAAGAG